MHYKNVVLILNNQLHLSLFLILNSLILYYNQHNPLPYNEYNDYHLVQLSHRHDIYFLLVVLT